MAICNVTLMLRHWGEWDEEGKRSLGTKAMQGEYGDNGVCKVDEEGKRSLGMKATQGEYGDNGVGKVDEEGKTCLGMDASVCQGLARGMRMGREVEVHGNKPLSMSKSSKFWKSPIRTSL